MSSFYVDIALPVPIDHTFTYSVPSEFQEQATVGSRVVVPFGKKTLTGVIVGQPGTSAVTNIRPIDDTLDTVPTFSGEMLKLTRWISEYYLAPWGEVLRAATPLGLTIQTKRTATLKSGITPETLASLKSSATKQRAVLTALLNERSISVAGLQKMVRLQSLNAILHQLEAKGLVEVREDVGTQRSKPKFETEVRMNKSGKSILAGKSGTGEKDVVRLTPRQMLVLQELAGRTQDVDEFRTVRSITQNSEISASTLKTLIRKGVLEASEREVFRRSEYDELEAAPNLTLNHDQAAALAAIEQSLQAGKYSTHLLLGVTGSGKTQVYIEAIRRLLALGKTAIVL
ncbi:MAG TPA: hypothetical protein VI758_10135, partial [Bacteroidota bacterium]